MPGPVESDSWGLGALTPSGAALLARLESSRDLLARQLVKDAHAITDPDLNLLTVSVLLQILFLKTGQECGFVEPGTLAALAGCDGIAKRMGRACLDAGLAPELFFENGPAGPRVLPAGPDEPLRGIISNLDNPEIPTPITQLPLEDLVTVFDHFVGTRMQVGEGYRVVRAGKSALLYTGTVDVPPQDMVEYTVTTSIRESGRRRFRILDPACGAGLFLLAAFRTLLRKNRGSEDRELTCPELQEILCTSVFGTDIDPESVSAARFVLLLAFIEESRKDGDEIISPHQLSLVCHGLTETIRCGNSLIAPDYFTGKPIFPFNAEERRRVNVFDWQAAFPAVIAEGGFDAVIGAPPPYRPFAVKDREEYFQTHYDTYAVSAGLFGYFIERGLGLLRPGGSLTLLVPGTFLRAQCARPLRRFLLTRQIVQIAGTGRTRRLPEGETMIYLLRVRNQAPEDPFVVSPELFPDQHSFSLDQKLLDDGGWRLEDTRTAEILGNIRAKGTLLEEYVMGEIGMGAHHIRNNPLVVDLETRNRLIKNAWWARRFFTPLLRPADVRRYVPVKSSRFVITETSTRKIRKCRALVQYLQHAAEMVNTDYGCDAAHDEPEFFQDASGKNVLPEQSLQKIIVPLFQHNPAFCFDHKGSFAVTSTLSAISRNDPYLAAILNSSLGRFVITHICPLMDRGYHISPSALGKFPVMVPDFEKRSDRKRHDKIVALVYQIISLHEYLPRARTDQERRLVQQEIDATDVRIDALVYELYGLTAEEIAVVEESSPS